jgi:hypothetical protein
LSTFLVGNFSNPFKRIETCTAQSGEELFEIEMKTFSSNQSSERKRKNVFVESFQSEAFKHSPA